MSALEVRLRALFTASIDHSAARELVSWTTAAFDAWKQGRFDSDHPAKSLVN
ncbi:uncharacterized protein SEPMUDRAFT_148389 [Sphaerulina musiva SO2202]|uniref:Uncharacterized protein n=1 Tax=Sphaerulina musiva (strain SO2202) TaxID=692275 RepID=M3DA70_SPHMS|nr:uncharacterized protein SEPMUDRAFT_148389 [Sphaerulina musiva SO2202]EMF14779.1 hypothetical protein SEPMUDRAFT_148389 [Sphaerulina musiva SO2202]